LGSAVIVILAFFAAAASRSLAQGDKPQLHRRENTPPEEKPPEKKKKTGKDPRAVGLLQLTSNGKATLIPIAILIDGKYYDASVYKADPVPMALDSGTVYEAQQESRQPKSMGSNRFLPAAWNRRSEDYTQSGRRACGAGRQRRR
jgi:hypothetical protein